MILLIGGTGTLGKEIAKLIPCRIYSRNEYFQWLCKQEVEAEYVLGDVRDYEALKKASEGVTDIINCSAIKHVSNCKFNPDEAIKTNIIGAQNIVRLGLPTIQVSTDKAVRPTTFYGATKMVAEGLFDRIVRLPNLYGSTGSVIEIWASQHERGLPLTVTDKDCSRYFITVEKAAQFVVNALVFNKGVHIPECEEWNIYELCRSLYPKDKIEITGLPEGEKLREELC